MEFSKLYQSAMVKGNNTEDAYVHGFFSFVADNYWNMSKEELVAIIKELDYTAQLNLNADDYNKLIDNTLDNIQDAEVFEDYRTEAILAEEAREAQDDKENLEADEAEAQRILDDKGINKAEYFYKKGDCIVAVLKGLVTTFEYYIDLEQGKIVNIEKS